MPYFNSKNRTIFSPRNAALEDFYNLLEKYEPIIGGSRVFEDMVDTYEFLDSTLKEEEE